MVTREVEGQLNTEDISSLQSSPVRNTPADHVVHGAVDALGITSVVEEGGISFMDDNQLSRKLIQFLSGHPGLNYSFDLLEDLPGEIGRLSYLDDLNLDQEE